MRWIVVLVLLSGACHLANSGGQHVSMEIANPQTGAAPAAGNAYEGMLNVYINMLLVGLNSETRGRCNTEWKRTIRKLPLEDRISLLKRMITKDHRQLTGLLSEKLNRAYDPRFGYSWYMNTVKSRLPLWIVHLVHIWHLWALLAVSIGVMGFVVSGDVAGPRSITGIVSLLVVAAFTVAILVFECQSRYKMAIYPLFFLVIPYARFLVDKDGLPNVLLRRSLAVAGKAIGGFRDAQRSVQRRK